MADLGFVHKFVPSNGSQVTLLMLHGTGGSEDDLLRLGMDIFPGAALLSPRGRVLENGMPRFFRRLSEGVFDIADLKGQTRALARFVAEASKAYGFRSDKVVAVGYSNGANIAGSTLLLHPQTLAGAVLIRPMVPFVPEKTPDLSRKPVLILAATRDPIVPSEQTERLARLMENWGADVSVRWAEGTHSLTSGDVAEAKSWLAAEFRG